jgi:hypothetical protein
MKVGDKIVARNVPGTLLHIDENPATGLPYLCVFIERGKSRAEWLSADDLRLAPKFVIGETWVNREGHKVLIHYVDNDAHQDRQDAVVGIMHPHSTMASTIKFTLHGMFYSHRDDDWDLMEKVQ